jgi:hypothetical protein
MNYSKTRLSWDLYRTAESYFFDFLEYVPLMKAHENVVSPKLLTLILQIGSYVDTTFKHMARNPKLSTYTNIQKILARLTKSRKDYATIADYRKAFEPIYRLSRREVVVKFQSFFFPTSTHPPFKDVFHTTLVPFCEFAKNDNPKWWKTYTGLKHYSLERIEDATMKNTLDALAGLFLLNVIDEQNWPELAWEVVQGELHNNRIFVPRFASTELFRFEWKEEIQSEWPATD